MKCLNIKTSIGMVCCLCLLWGCNPKKHHLMGSWLEEGTKNTSEEIRGFTLGKNGIASSINTPKLQYKTWDIDDDLLIINGKEIQDTCFLPKSDTLLIKRVTKKKLILLREGIRHHYVKEQ